VLELRPCIIHGIPLQCEVHGDSISIGLPVGSMGSLNNIQDKRESEPIDRLRISIYVLIILDRSFEADNPFFWADRGTCL
jgi:hypothetical protein